MREKPKFRKAKTALISGAKKEEEIVEREF